MEKFKTTVKYWKIVITEALRIALESSGMKGLTVTLLLVLLISTVLSYLTRIGKLPENLHILVGDFSAELRTSIVYLIVALLISSIIFIFAVVYTPAKIHNEQNKKIAKLTSKNTSRTVKTNKIKFVPKEEYPKLKNDSFYAYLEIQNAENEDLRDCFVTLNKLYVKDVHGWLNITNQLNPNFSNLTWPDFKREEEKIIRRKKSCRINIAKTIPNNIAFIFEHGDTSALFSMPEYFIEVELNGLIKGKPIDGVIFQGVLHYIARLTQEENRPPMPYYRLYIEAGNIDKSKVQ